MLVHPEIDPIAISIGPLDVHWYGLMYLIGFAIAWLVAMKRSEQPWSPVKKDQVEDLIFWCAVALIVGARIGYAFFYQFDKVLENPLWLFKVWEGGMSFHGGFWGIALTLWWFSAKKAKRPFFEITDFLTVTAPLGIFAGRMGNFINQELWGRPTEVAWGMVFPKAGDGLARHASQLYEGILEGLVLFAILFWFSSKPRPRGAATGIFLAWYGMSRFFVEFFREPDAHIGFDFFGWMTRGQILTLPLIALGIWFLVRAYQKKQYPAGVKI